MAGTLIDYGMRVNTAIEATVIRDYTEYAPLLQMLDLETTGDLARVYRYWKSITPPGKRKINEAYTTAEATLAQKSEQVSMYGCYIDTDVAEVRTQKEADLRGERQAQIMYAHACDFNDDFINGSQIIDNEEMNGLAWRLANDTVIPAGNKLHASTAAGGLDVLASSANMQSFFDSLNKLKYALPGHGKRGKVVLWMNSTSLLNIESTLRRQGLLTTTKDAYGREINTWGNAMLIDIGVKYDDTTNIILNTEADYGAGAALSTSIYATVLGKGFLWGQQAYPMRIVDKGELEDGVTMRTLVDWPVTLAMGDKRSIAKLDSIYWTNA